MRGSLVVVLLAAAACGGGGPERFAVVFDPCQRLAATPAADSTAAEAAGISAGLDLWNAAAHTALELGPDDGVPSVPVRFQKAASSFFGLYDGDHGIVFINSELTDGHALAVTVAHELGHSFGLFHVGASVRPSVMNPGNLTVGPTAADVAALGALWGACEPPTP